MQRQFHRFGHHCLAFFQGAKGALIQGIPNLLEFRIRHIGDEWLNPLDAAIQVHLLELPLFIPRQTRREPASRVQIPLTICRIRPDPDGSCFRRSLILAVDRKTNLFQLVRHVIAHGFACSIAIRTDQEDQRNRRAIVFPFSIRTLGCAHARHFLGDDFSGLIQVVSVFGFQGTCRINQGSVFHQLGGKCKEFWQ